MPVDEKGEGKGERGTQLWLHCDGGKLAGQRGCQDGTTGREGGAICQEMWGWGGVLGEPYEAPANSTCTKTASWVVMGRSQGRAGGV